MNDNGRMYGPMNDDEKRLLEEIDFWLRFHDDYVRRHNSAPSRRMQEALFDALDRLRALGAAGSADELEQAALAAYATLH